MSRPGRLTETVEGRFWRSLHNAERFFVGDANVQKALEHGVDIVVMLTGSYPGDGRPKPVAFPDPATTAERGARVALLPLPTLIELKLASGMTAPHRLKDLADVLELVRAAKLPADLASEFDPYVREKYLELWRAAQVDDAE